MMISRIFLAVALLCAVSYAQVTVAPILQPHQTFVDQAGAPCAGCSLFSYTAGTTTPTPTFQDAGGTVQNTNPIVLSVQGGADVWVDTSKAYKFVLKNTSGTTLWTVDNIKAPGAGSISTTPGGSQGITQPPGTNFDINTSGGGKFTYNGSEVLNTSTGVQTNPAGNQTVNQPSGTTLGVSSLNGVRNAALATGVDIGAQINAVVTACAGAVCPIYVPAGTYTFITPIVLATNVELYGAGKALTNLFFNPGSVQTALTINAANVKVHDLQVYGTTETPATASSYNGNFGISVGASASNVAIDNVRAAHFWGYGNGVNIGGSHNTLSNSIVEYTTYGVGGNGSYINILNNYISPHYTQAKSFEAPKVHYWDCINAEGSTGAIIRGNFVEDCGQSGIYFGANAHVTTGSVIVGNTVSPYRLESWHRCRSYRERQPDKFKRQFRYFEQFSHGQLSGQYLADMQFESISRRKHFKIYG